MPRVFISPQDVRGNCVTVSDREDVHHLLHVLRVKAGDRLECLGGAGRHYAGQIVRCTRQKILVEIDERFEETPPPVRLLLAQALIKPERFDWVVQKATELGVNRVTPLITERTVVRPRQDAAQRKVVRWQRIAREAATQCGRSSIPAIDAAQPFDQFAPSLARYSLVLMPTLAVAASPFRAELEGLKEAAVVMTLIGPEGDFTLEEIALAQRYGARAVSLGHLTLRSETATIATLAILQHTAGVL